MFSKSNQSDKIQKFSEYIDNSHRIVAITGAGISIGGGGVSYGGLSGAIRAGGGIPASSNHSDESFLKPYVKAMLHYKPSLSHYALADLEREGKLIGIITTNEDCMHTIAGAQNVAEIQGSFQINYCESCGRRYGGYKIWLGENLPKCDSCGGTILPWQLYSHISLWNDDVLKARNWISKADMIIVIGTNGYYGGAYWGYRRSDAVIVQINPGRTAFDRVADLNIREECDNVFRELTSGLDPVMQETFIDFIKEEKARGKTIFLSSHIFHEVDASCDRIAIIRDGKIVSEFRSEELKSSHDRIYRVTFKDERSPRSAPFMSLALPPDIPRPPGPRMGLELLCGIISHLLIH